MNYYTREAARDTPITDDDHSRVAANGRGVGDGDANFSFQCAGVGIFGVNASEFVSENKTTECLYETDYMGNCSCYSGEMKEGGLGAVTEQSCKGDGLGASQTA